VRVTRGNATIGALARDGEALAGAALVALGVHIVRQALGWEIMGPDGPGPGFFPFGYGALMIVLSVALIVGRVRRAGAAAPAAPGAWRAHVRPLVTWLAFALAALLMPVIGFVPAFAGLTLFMARFVFARAWGSSVLVAALCALGFWILFPVLLDVRLPAGPLGF
jgi:hypothetical protein